MWRYIIYNVEIYYIESNVEGPRGEGHHLLPAQVLNAPVTRTLDPRRLLVAKLPSSSSRTLTLHPRTPALGDSTGRGGVREGGLGGGWGAGVGEGQGGGRRGTLGRRCACNGAALLGRSGLCVGPSPTPSPPAVLGCPSSPSPLPSPAPLLSILFRLPGARVRFTHVLCGLAVALALGIDIRPPHRQLA